MLIRRPLTLRFAELGDGGEGAGGGEPAPVIDQGQQAAPEQGQQTQGQQATGGNPAWDSLRSELDPISFSKIEPHLKSWDAGVQKRIEQANSQFTPFQPHLEGRQPEFIGKAVAYAEALEEDPARVYQMLGQFLQQTGRFPTQAEAEQQLEEDDSPEQQADPRLAQLQAQQEQILHHIQQQAQQEAVGKANSELETALGGLRHAHPELSEDDTQEIIKRAAFAAQRSPGQNIDFAKAFDGAYQEFSALKNRILSTPRPVDSAPQLLPVSGGAPTAPGQQQKGWAQYSNDEIQNFIAGGLAQNRG